MSLVSEGAFIKVGRDLKEAIAQRDAQRASMDRALTFARAARSRHMSSTDPSECMECDHYTRVSNSTQGMICREAMSLDEIIAALQ